MQPSVRSRKLKEASRVGPFGGEICRVRGHEPDYSRVWQRSVVPILMVAAFLLMSAAVIVGFEESKPPPKCFAISSAGPLCR
jgi:uncharacterized Fe-S cluster-containing radical SAM superfamily protein